MIVNKKLDRLKQWAGERMGGEVKTNVSDDFKALEQEMNLRHEGMERLQKSMTAYVKALSKRNEGDDKEKPLAVGHLGSTMVHHGEDFDCDSEFGQCLIQFGRTHERIARTQEQYISTATTTWLESADRSLAQLKEYQAARKKLESRRLAYDTSLAKVQKAKREDFRVEEELRSQKAKYEEANEDVHRRMQDIKDFEADSVADLGAFLEAELGYHDKCREVLLQLRDNWPAGDAPGRPSSRPPARSRSNTAHSYRDRYEPVQEPAPPPTPERPVIRSGRTPSLYQAESPPRDPYADPPYRASTHIPNENSSFTNARSQLRAVTRGSDENYNGTIVRGGGGSPERHYVSEHRPGSSVSSRPGMPYRSVSVNTVSTLNSSGGTLGKKAPPPPPPSRAKKPPPPPPPMKRYSTAVDL